LFNIRLALGKSGCLEANFLGKVRRIYRRLHAHWTTTSLSSSSSFSDRTMISRLSDHRLLAK
jgi:hypothetical protein